MKPTIIAPTLWLALALAGTGAAQPQSGGPAHAPAAARLAAPIPVVLFEGNRLTDVLEFLRSTTGVNFSVNWPALKDVGVDGKMPIGLQLTDVPAATALQLVLKQAISSDADNPVALGVVDGTVTISTRQDLKQRKAVAFQLPEAYIADANSRTARKLAVPIPVVNLDGNKLCNVIEFLRNTTGANFFCNWSAIQAAGADPYVAITLQRTNVPADQVLTLVLQQARTSDAKNPITYGIVDGVIIISTLQDLQAMPDREKIRTAQERGTAAPASQPAAGGP